MIPLSLAEIAEITGGRLVDVDDPEARVTGTVEFDSRKVTPGGLFLALPGARVDGHDHASGAVSAGAVAVLAARPVGVPAIVVEPIGGSSGSYVLEHDTDGSGAAVLAALSKLARAVVDRLASGTAVGGGPENRPRYEGGSEGPTVRASCTGLTVVGVTGSAGKTSTKDLIAAVLAPLGPVVAPPGSFNNELGHPWTALRADESTRFLVLEMSARGPGHIAALARTAPPRIGVELNVGTAHLGEFGSREMIAQAKGELVEALPSAADGGVAVLNADDLAVVGMAPRTTAKIVLAGQAANADVRAVDVRLDEQARAGFTLATSEGSVSVQLAVSGEHQVGNALSAAAVALACGATLQQVADALATSGPVSARRMDVQTRADGVTVINDSYNANPDSMKAAIKALVSMARATRPARRTWAILGDMAELGDDAVVEHDAIGRFAVRLDVSRLIVVGTSRAARAMHQGAVMEGSWGNESILTESLDEAIALVRAEVAPGDVVLVKASNSVGMWVVAEALLASGE